METNSQALTKGYDCLIKTNLRFIKASSILRQLDKKQKKLEEKRTDTLQAQKKPR